MTITRPKKKKKSDRKTRAGRKAKHPAVIANRFTPRFWEDTDNRQRIIRRIKRRVERLKEECGADSYQRELLCERAVFIALQLETAEVEALKGNEFREGSYTQMVNALSGLLSKLGLNKQVVESESLNEYVSKRKLNGRR